MILRRTNITQFDSETRRLIYRRKLAGDKIALLMKEYNCSANVINDILNEGLEQDQIEYKTKKRLAKMQEPEHIIFSKYTPLMADDLTIGDVIVSQGEIIRRFD